MTHSFAAAPWSPLLRLTSALSLLLLLALSYAASRVIPAVAAAHLVGAVVAVLPLMIGMAALLFVVNGYEIDARELRVQRLLWQTRVPLTGLQRVTLQPELLKGSIRVVGNGGMLSFSGSYYRRDLGRYRAFITDWRKSVLLVTSGGAIAISPADPAPLLHTLQLLYPAVKVI